MTKTTLMDKYPLLTLDIAKSDTNYKNIPEILAYFKNKIDNDKIAKYIAVFDHYDHTQGLGDDGFIAEEILDVQNIIFCFGPKIPNALVPAVRPRSIAIVEYKDKFTLSFMEAPMPTMSEKMEMWVKGLQK